MHSSTRRVLIMLSGLLLCTAWLCSTALPASAGGPTSVIMVRPDTGQAAALHTTDPRYEQLVEAVQAYRPPAGSVTEPSGVTECQGCEIRLTWLIHDMRIWRIDRVRLTPDAGIWLQSVADESGGDVLELSPVWQRAADPTALTGLLSGLGMLGGTGETSTPPASEWVAGAAVTDGADRSAGSGVLLAVAAAAGGLVGLTVGVPVGRHRRRPDHRERPDRPERTVLSG